MRGHWESNTRKLNHHYQSSKNGGGPTPPPIPIVTVGMNINNGYVGALRFDENYKMLKNGPDPTGRFFIRDFKAWQVGYGVVILGQQKRYINSDGDLVQSNYEGTEGYGNWARISFTYRQVSFTTVGYGPYEELKAFLDSNPNPYGYLEDLQPATVSSQQMFPGQKYFENFAPYAQGNNITFDPLVSDEYNFDSAFINDFTAHCSTRCYGGSSTFNVPYFDLMCSYSNANPSKKNKIGYLNRTAYEYGYNENIIPVSNYTLYPYIEKGKKYGYMHRFLEISDSINRNGDRVSNGFNDVYATVSLFCGRSNNILV